MVMCSINSDKEREVTIGHKYKIIFSHKLGQGGFGQLYLGYFRETKEHLAIKVESITTNSKKLETEAKLLKQLQGGTGIPKLYDFITEINCNFILMELLGKNLEILFKICNKALSLKTILTLFYQMINRIEYVHNKHIIHKDIKPENFLIGNTPQTNHTLFLIDYGLSRKYIDSFTKEHIKYKNNKPMIGTERYASVSTHLGIEQTRRDDMESILYVVFYLIKGRLPWQRLKAKSNTDKILKIKDVKANASKEELCGKDAMELWELLVYTKQLKFEAKPDYDYYRKVILDLLQIRKIKVDNVFEWDNLDIEKELLRIENMKKNKKPK